MASSRKEVIELDVKELDYQTEEAIKTLRTNIRFCGEDKKVIDITSSVPNEGKSLISLKLAQSMAQSGLRTVLIDADLRKSTMMSKKISGTYNGGLTNYLIGQRDYMDFICRTNVENLSVMFTGPFPPNPAELLESPKFARLLESLKAEYDYVVIDTPPLGSVIDSAVIARYCDGVVMVIEQGKVGVKFAKSVINQLKKSECPLLGVVLNKADMQSGGKRYGKYYGKYYGEYSAQKKEP